MAKADIQRDWPDWAIGELLGGGGYGTVYEMHREVFGDVEQKALKVIYIPKDNTEVEFLRAEGLSDEAISTTFYGRMGDIAREYKIMAKLRGNPNIVCCDDLKYTRQEDDIGWVIYIKMELLTPLMQALNQVQAETQILNLGIQMCNALAACQSVSVIHRDVKPQNILISPDGTFKLGDFGIARTLEHTTKATAGTGTFSFMAPEVAKAQPYGSTVDIYSLGMVLYWLLNEHRGPFLSLDSDSLSYAHKDEAIMRRLSGEPLPMPKNGSSRLKLAVLKACAYDPKDRFQTPQAFMEELIRIRDGSDADETVDHIPPRGSTYVPRQEPPRQVPRPEKPLPASSQKAHYEDSLAPSPVKAQIIVPLMAAVAVLTTIIGLTFFLSTRYRNNSAKIRQEASKPSTAVTVATEDPAEVAYRNVVAHCDELKATGAYSEAVRYLEDCVAKNGQDPRYADLLDEYENLLKESILETAAGYAAAGQLRLAIYTLDGAWKTYGYQELRDCAATYRKDFGIRNTAYFSAGKYNTILVREDCVAQIVGDDTYGELDARGWTDIIAVGAGDRHVIGLKANGTVVAAGENRYRQCAVGDWRDVAAISAGDVHTVALTQNGSVLATGYNDQNQCQVEKLMRAAGEREIVSVAAGYHQTLALLDDGTVVACGSDRVYDGCCDVYNWSDIASIYAGTSFSAGLKSDGTVVAVGVNRAGKNVNSVWDFSGWTDIINLAAGDYFLVGLRSDGTVLISGLSDEIGNNAASEISAWNNIVQISAGNDHVVALTANGKILCAGKDNYGQCDFQGKTVFYPGLTRMPWE